MEISDRLPTVCSNYPWLVAQNLEAEENVFYKVHDPTSYYRCRIPELVGRQIRACFHGWVILTDHPHNIHWSLWNPLTSKLIHLPDLIIEDNEDVGHCCLSSPPDNPDSILILMRRTKHNIIFRKINNNLMRWTEISYYKQLKSIIDDRHNLLKEMIKEKITLGWEEFESYRTPDNKYGFLLYPTYCDGKIYAWVDSISFPSPPIQVDILLKEEEEEEEAYMISLLSLPSMTSNVEVPRGEIINEYFKESCGELFFLIVGVTKETLIDVKLCKFDMTRKELIEVKHFNDAVFFLDMATDDLVYCSPAVASEFGGYVHVINNTRKVIYSYNVKDKTISMQSLDLPPRSIIGGISVSELRLKSNDDECKDDLNQDMGMVVRSTTTQQNIESHLLNIPFDVLGMIMGLCVGIEYLNFRATCKICRFVAPEIRWSNEKRLEKYSLVSPWLMVFDKNEGIISFTNPMFGEDKYCVNASPELFYDYRILCSRYGWLLLYIDESLPMFFNPFTGDIRKLPDNRSDNRYADNFCFSAPPTSPDCMVVGFCSTHVYFHFVGGEPFWDRIDLNFDGLLSYGFPMFYGRDVYVMLKGGGLEVFRNMDNINNLSWEAIVDEVITPTTCSLEYFHAKCDQHHLLVIVGKFGESIEVFKLNDFTYEWEKLDNLGTHMIFISDTTCLCMDAKTPEMENKIYFSRWHCDNGRIVFYSLETCKYHTFNGRNMEQNMTDFFGTKKTVYAHAWIEPNWS